MPLILLGVSGCNPPPRPVLGKTVVTETVEPLAADKGTTATDIDLPRAYTTDWQAWQAYFRNHRHVGFNHVSVVSATEANQPVVRIDLDDQIVVKRGPAQVAQRLQQRSIESPDGQLKSFESTLTIGPDVTAVSGTVDGSSLVIVTTRGTQQSTRRLPWEPSYSGLTGVQQTLRSAPLTRDQSRRLTVLLPILYEWATVDLVCTYLASIPMPDGTVRQAREIDVTVRPTSAAPFQTVIWTDEQGHVIKTLSPTVNLTAFDTPQSDAIADRVPSDRLNEATWLAVRGQLDTDQIATQVAYRFTPLPTAAADSPNVTITPQPGQWVKPLPGGGFDVAVSRKSLATSPPGFESLLLVPTPADSRPSALVDSGHHRVQQLASTAVSPTSNRPRLARELARTAHSLIRKRGNTRGLLPASQVAIDGEADSTGHAILLTAMLRARGIPARIAVGLAYHPTDELPAMRYQMWTLAYVDDDWLHLDAQLPSGEAAADRIILQTHSLAGNDLGELFTPFLQTLERFNLEIARANYGSLAPSSTPPAAPAD